MDTKQSPPGTSISPTIHFGPQALPVNERIPMGLPGQEINADRPGPAPSRIHRPWGWFETLAEGPDYRVKRLYLNPGRRISLQRHGHRSEHWVVVNGSGWLTSNGETTAAVPGTALFIPVAAIHRAEADGDASGLEIIEVQRGNWLSEDDIERFEDDFGRLGPAA
jgi:mannose-6-phosphate isomerase